VMNANPEELAVTGSTTDGVNAALAALELGPGDEVVTQANTCVPTVSAIERAGATPVLCDVEPEAGTIDLDSLRGALGERTRAVIPVHLYGQCADVDAVLELCEPREIPVVEDCAQAVGAELGGRRAGTIGALGCFSFYPTKNLAALGDGGAVVTDDDRLAERLRLVRQYGQTDRYRHVTEGVNSRLDELQAAVLRTRLPYLEGWNERRAEIAAVRGSAARMINLSGQDARTTFDQLEALLCNWREILRKLDERGPFIYNATRTGGLKPVPLRSDRT